MKVNSSKSMGRRELLVKNKMISEKSRQLELEESINRVDALKFLLDANIISLHDYWILTGRYKVIRDC